MSESNIYSLSKYNDDDDDDDDDENYYKKTKVGYSLAGLQNLWPWTHVEVV